ncbi:hypothetical protein BC940DRAFT_307056 [Gongronella butleri]|nr:hypothetical protein BC940DRAFT_307056 [Gongronella butleri]
MVHWPAHSFFLLISAALGHGCGVLVHNEVTHRAIELFQPTSAIEQTFRGYVTDHPGYLQAGSFFPDWGYQCLGNDQQAEDAHWAPFIKAAIDHIRDTYPGPWGDDSDHVKGLVAFVLGVLSHDVADVKWHSLNGLKDYFIQAMAHMDFDGDEQAAHQVADTGGEAVLRHSAHLDYLADQWELPLDDILRIYERLYNAHPGTAVPNAEHVRYCMMRAFAGIKLDVGLAKYLFNFYGAKSPFLVTQLDDYHSGGLQDMAASVTNCYSQAIGMMLQGEKVHEPLCGLYFDNNKHVRFARNATTRGPRCHHHTKGHEIDVSKRVRAIVDEDTGVWTFSAIERDDAPAAALLNFQHPFTLHQNGAADELAKKIENDAQLASIDGKSAKDEFTTCHVADGDHDDETVVSMGSSLGGFGHAMVSGDFDGDGRQELVVSSPYDSPDLALIMAGAVFVMDGNQESEDDAQARPHDEKGKNDKANARHKLRGRRRHVSLGGTVPGGRFGWAMAVVDMNNDGIDDLAVASPFGPDGGHVDVFYGKKGQGLSPKRRIRIERPSFSLLGNGKSGYGAVLKGLEQQHALAIGCPHCPNAHGDRQGGIVDVLTSVDDVPMTLESPTPMAYAHFGASIAPLDGTLLIGAPGTRVNDQPQAGQVFAFLNGKVVRSMSGKTAFGRFGSFLAQWQNQWLAIASPIEDVKRPLQKAWQAGVVRVFAWPLKSSADEPVIVLEGKEKSGHFGSSLAFYNDAATGKAGLWIGEPFGAQEDGKVYQWVPGQELRCFGQGANLARFGSPLIHLDAHGAASHVRLAIASLHFRNQDQKQTGAIHLYSLEKQ